MKYDEFKYTLKYFVPDFDKTEKPTNKFCETCNVNLPCADNPYGYRSYCLLCNPESTTMASKVWKAILNCIKTEKNHNYFFIKEYVIQHIEFDEFHTTPDLKLLAFDQAFDTLKFFHKYIELKDQTDYEFDEDGDKIEVDYRDRLLFVFKTACFEKVYVSVYQSTQSYGGPEEGGWYYDYNELITSVPTQRHNVNNLQNYLENFYNTESKSFRNNYSNYFLMVEDNPGDNETKETPRYE